LKDLKKNEDIPFSEFLNSLNLNENTCILSLKRYYNNIESKWTSIETIIKDIRVGKF
jgi:hypothetical protein